MASVVSFVLRFRLLALATAAAVLGAGVLQLRSTTFDTLPEYAPAYVEIQTEALGLSAEEVEQLITVPMEADLLNGVEGIETLRSESVPGLSSIVLVFEPGRDIYQERQLVQERLTQAHALPHVSRPPEMLPPMSVSNRVAIVGLTSQKLTRIEQSVLARWVIKPALMGVPGVANVSMWGLRDQQLQVRVDPERLRRNQITLAQIVSSAGNAQVVSPLTFLEASTPGTGGFIETPQQRLQVRHLIEAIANPGALGKVPVEGTSDGLRLAEVADVSVGHQPLIGDAVVNGRPGLALVVEKFPGADTATVAKDVRSVLDELRPGLTGMRMDTTSFQPARYFETAGRNLGLATAAGAVLMLLLILIGSRYRWRLAVVAGVTIPLSLLSAAWVLHVLGHSLNTLTLAGLAAATAIVVDEAVASTDAVFDRLRRQSGADGQAVTTAVVLDASLEVRRPLAYATAICLLVVVPVAVMQGVTDAFFGPLVAAYALAVLAAMVVALTVTPVLTSLVMSQHSTPAGGSDLSSVRARYLTTLRQVLQKRVRVAAIAALAVVAALVALPFLGTSLVPQLQDPSVEVTLSGTPGTSSRQMTATSTKVSRALKEVPGVTGTTAQIGRAVTGDTVANVDSATVWAQVADDADYSATVRAIRDTAAEVSRVDAEVTTYTSSRIRRIGALPSGANDAPDGEVAVLSGGDDRLTVRLFGEDLATLKGQGNRLRDIVADVDGVRDIQLELPPMQDTVEIEVGLDEARALGVTPGYVRRAAATLLQGIQVGSVFKDQKVFDVVVQGTPTIRENIADIRRLLLDVPGGGYLRLGRVADVRTVETPAVIQRDAVSRRLDVTAGVSGRSVDAVAADLTTRLAAVDFPLEYHVEVMTQSVNDEAGMSRVRLVALGVAIAVFLLLQAAFRSWRRAFLGMLALPPALVGGVVAVLVATNGITLGALLGLLATFGVAVRVVIAMVFALQAREARAPVGDVVEDAALQRFGSIATSLTALAGLTLPFVVLGPRAGLEVIHPLAQVLLGGLVTTALTVLYLVPVLYSAFGRSTKPVRATVRTGAEVPAAGSSLTWQGSTS